MYSLCAAVEEDSRKCPVGVQLKKLFLQGQPQKNSVKIWKCIGEEYKMEENKIEDKTEKTFKELYLAGEIGFDEIDRYISHRNNSDDERTLAVYLGLNADEEDVWIDESDEALQEMLDKQKARG